MIYNTLVSKSRTDCFQLAQKDLAAKYRGIAQKHSLANHLPSYHLEVPEEVMDSTYRDFIKAIKTSKALFRSLVKSGKRTTYPNLGFKTLKDNSSTIEIRSRSIKIPTDGIVRFFPTFLGKDGIVIKETLPDLTCSVRLMRTRLSEFYLIIPRTREFEQSNSLKTCAIDPGSRDFITVYDPSGLVVGITDANRAIAKRCFHIDRLKAKLSQEVRNRVRKRLKKTIYNIEQRITNMINDCHQKVSKWLAENYREVLLPKFETSKMTKKENRKIGKQTTRSMLNWSHYKFKEMLRMKMERAGGRLIDCTEPYTSKTCSACGIVNRKFKAEKTFKCLSCNHTNDRDVNASRNIYMMNEHLLTWTLRVQLMEKPTPWVSGAGDCQAVCVPNKKRLLLPQLDDVILVTHDNSH